MFKPLTSMTLAATLLAPAHALLAAEEGGGGSALLKVEPSMAIWTLIVFILLVIIMGKWVWPPILSALNDREAKVREDFEEAEKARQQAQKTLDDYKTQLAEARREAQQIIEKSRADARQLAEQLKEKTQQDLVHMRQRMEADLESAKEQAVAEVYEQTAVIATQVASRILSREISPDDQRELVDQSLKEFQTIHQN